MKDLNINEGIFNEGKSKEKGNKISKSFYSIFLFFILFFEIKFENIIRIRFIISFFFLFGNIFSFVTNF